jgi:hypothetical protein
MTATENPAVSARIGSFDTIGADSSDEKLQKEAITSILTKAALDVSRVFDKPGIDYDMGRLLASLDALKHAKNIAHESIDMGRELKKRKKN